MLLHYAMANQASEAVVAALLEAHPEAAKQKTNVLPPWPHTLRAAPQRMRARALSLACRHAVQIGKLPLHWAAANEASEAVVKALLAEYPDAATEKDEVRPPYQRALRAAPRRMCARALTHLAPR